MGPSTWRGPSIKEWKAMKLYVIYDRAAEECGPVYEAKNDQVAIRQFKQVMEKAIAGAWDEFWLYSVGELDTKTMRIIPGLNRVEIQKKGDIEDGK